MAKLKNRQEFIPGGFRAVIPFTGWDLRKVLPNQSFNASSMKLWEHMKGNRFQFQQAGIEVSMASAESIIEEQSVRAMISEGHTGFIMDAAPQAQSFPMPLPLPKGHVAAAAVGVVNKVRRAVAGVSVLREWLGSGLKPVDRPLAEKRAAICAQCVKNVEPGWFQKLTGAIAEQLRLLVSMKEDLALETKHDKDLHRCECCDCYLPLKVHVSLEHILKGTGPETMACLKTVEPKCWIANNDA